MAYENNYDFSDWLYNSYVKAQRKRDYIRMSVFLEALNQYIIKAVAHRKYGQLRRHAKELLKDIDRANRQGKAEKLLLTGQEGQAEFNSTIAHYEQSLRKMNLSEDTITELVIEKKLSYGND